MGDEYGAVKAARIWSKRKFVAHYNRRDKIANRGHKPKCDGTKYPLTGLCVAECGYRRGDQFTAGDLEDLAIIERDYGMNPDEETDPDIRAMMGIDDGYYV